MKKTIIIILLLAFSAGAIQAQVNPNAGTTGSDLLKIGVGARTTALGDSFVGIADDPYAIYWNPAGITQIRTFIVSASYTSWIMDSTCGFIAYVHPLHKIGFLGASLIYMDYGEIARTTDSFTQIDTFRASESLFTLSYAYPEILFGLSAGANIKILNKSIDTFSSSAIAIDLGVLYELPTVKRDINVGMSIQNIGTNTSFNTIDVSDNLPSNFKIGLGWRFLRLGMHKAFLAVDANNALDSNWRLSLGSEYCFRDMFYGRLGYKLGYDTSWLTLGIGFKSNNNQFDYSFSPMRFFGPSHRLSISFAWGKPYGMDILDYDKDTRKRVLYRNMKRNLMEQGRSLYKAGKYRKAIRKLKKALKIGIGPENERIVRFIGRIENKIQEEKEY